MQSAPVPPSGGLRVEEPGQADRDCLHRRDDVTNALSLRVVPTSEEIGVLIESFAFRIALSTSPEPLRVGEISTLNEPVSAGPFFFDPIFDPTGRD